MNGVEKYLQEYLNRQKLEEMKNKIELTIEVNPKRGKDTYQRFRKGKTFNVYDLHHNFVAQFGSMKEFVNLTGFYDEYVRDCLRGIKPSYRNYIFEYAEE